MVILVFVGIYKLVYFLYYLIKGYSFVFCFGKRVIVRFRFVCSDVYFCFNCVVFVDGREGFVFVDGVLMGGRMFVFYCKEELKRLEGF